MCNINKENELNEKQIKLFEILKKHALAKSTISYGEVSTEIYGHPFGGRALGYHAGCVSVFCLRNGLPALSAILCNKKTHSPGNGFDGMYNNFYHNKPSKHILPEKREHQIQNIQKAIYKTDWDI